MSGGEHWIVDIFDFPDVPAKRTLDVLVEAAKKMTATIVGQYHNEADHERTAMVNLDESHLTIHDYRDGEAALDMFTCGNKDMQVGFDYIQDVLKFKDYQFVLQRSRF